MEGDIAFDKAEIPNQPLLQDEDEQADYSENGMIQFKKSNKKQRANFTFALFVFKRLLIYVS
ncbi:C32 tRNA thiolase [Actinobacillus equuli]|nr:C32 tRNA thiolase [Actinobacillus equuli]